MDRDPLKDIYLKAIEIIANKYNADIYAALAYGSHIAGYAGRDSDYDIIMVIDGFRDVIKYDYMDIDGYRVSALIVDKDYFEEDVYEAKHGEFVSGRLYSVYIPIINKEYISRVEIDLKKRTILEESCILLKKYGGLIDVINIPLKYFMLSRLLRRIKIYPPVKYSYFKTFYGRRGRHNLEAALNGFRQAAEMLVDEGVLVRVDEDVYRVNRSRLKCRDRLGFIRFIGRGIKAYLAHGRSAKVPPSVFIEEAASKIRRGRERIDLPLEFREPESLLIDATGIKIFDRRSIKDLVREYSGKGLEYRISRRGLFSEVYSINYNGERIIAKRFSLAYIFKWLLIQVWLIDIYRFSIMPRSRFIREMAMNIALRDIGVNVPKIRYVGVGDRIIYYEHLGGERLTTIWDKCDLDTLSKYFRAIGRLIGYIHSKNICIGDLKPQNIIICNDNIFLVDLEQAGYKDIYHWDIVELLYYSAKYFSKLPSKHLEKLFKEFLNGYVEYMDVKYIWKAASIRYIRPFIIITPLNRLIRIFRLLRNFSPPT